jgi:hypothetical protein
MGDERFQSDRQNDPIAELARLIAQSDTYAARTSAGDRFREEIVSNGYNKSPELPPAPQRPVDLNQLEQAFERDEHLREEQAHDFDDRPCVADERYQNELLRARRRSLTLLMAISGLALIGSACAFGYRDVFGGSAPPAVEAINETNRIAPAPVEPQAKRNDNARQAGAATAALIDNTVSPKEQLTTTIVPPKEAAAESSGHHSSVATASRRAGKSGAMDVTAALNPEHLVGAPNAANATSAPAITPLALGRGYAVQVTSERSEGRAQAAFRSLQAKYPGQLSGREPIIRRADLGGAAGIYYRALVGPFASAEIAAKLCSGLKAAGGDCIVQKIER